MSLEEFIRQTKEAQALKRAMAVKMRTSGYSVEQIATLLGVKKTFIYTWQEVYESNGQDASCFALGYRGSEGYLTAQQRQEVVQFLQQRDHYSVKELKQYLQEHYQVAYHSEQSYYELLKAGGLSWKKTQKYNPKHDAQVAGERVEAIKKNWSRIERK